MNKEAKEYLRVRFKLMVLEFGATFLIQIAWPITV